MQDLFKMRRRKHATTRGKLLAANQHLRFANDAEFKQSWSLGEKASLCERHTGVTAAFVVRLCSADNT